MDYQKIITLLACSGLAYIMVLFFKKYLYKKYSKPFVIDHYADFIPSKDIINDSIIYNHDGSFTSILKIEGASYFEAEDLEKAQAEAYKLRSQVFNLQSIPKAIRIQFFFKHLKVDERLANNNFISITTQNIQELKDVTKRLELGLEHFKARLLNNTNFELSHFLYEHCNLVKAPTNFFDGSRLELNQICSATEITFHDEYGSIQQLGHEKYFKCFSLHFGNEIDSKYFFDLLTSTFECEYIINSEFFSRNEAFELLSVEKKNITASLDQENEHTGETTLTHSKSSVSKKKILETKEVQEILEAEDASLLCMDSFVLVYASSPKELSSISTLMQAVMVRNQVVALEEKTLLNFFFLQRLPACKLPVRKAFSQFGSILLFAKKTLSNTLAGMVDYVQAPSGLNKCDWGDYPIATLSTHYNSSYNFYFHVNEKPTSVGHGVVIAPTGAGKTTIVQYFMKGILDKYPEVDIYAFDRFNGISVFTAWQKGNDITFEDLAMNPLQIDLSEQENIDFLNNFLILLSKAKTSQELEQISILVEAIACIEVEDRILKYIVEDTVPEGTIKDNLTIWASGQYERYFNAPLEKLELSNPLTTFQMDKVLENEDLATPIVFYIMHKIRLKARKTGRGHFVFIDETAPMMQNQYFRSQIKVLLQEHRKLRGCVWLAFQNASSFEEKEIRELVLNQCQNQLVFAGTGIDEQTLKTLKIDNSIYTELQNVQKRQSNPYFVILNRPNEKVILNCNLQDKIALKFLSSSSKDVNKMRELKEQHGENWVEYF